MKSEEEIECEKLYQEWVHSSGLTPLTGTQFRFAMFLFQNRSMISKIGNLEEIFTSVRKFLKSSKSK
jgi:hypothetical protein